MQNRQAYAPIRRHPQQALETQQPSKNTSAGNLITAHKSRKYFSKATTDNTSDSSQMAPRNTAQNKQQKKVSSETMAARQEQENPDKLKSYSSSSKIYNEIKRKRLMRDSKSRERLITVREPREAPVAAGKPQRPVLSNGSPQLQKDIDRNTQFSRILNVSNSGLEEKEHKIKKYIHVLQKELIKIQKQKQRNTEKKTLANWNYSTDRDLAVSTKAKNLTERPNTAVRETQPIEISETDRVRQVLKFDKMSGEGFEKRLIKSTLNNNQGANSHSSQPGASFVHELIKKAKQENKQISLNQIRNQYKQLSPSKAARPILQDSPTGFATERIAQNHTISTGMVNLPQQTKTEHGGTPKIVNRKDIDKNSQIDHSPGILKDIVDDFSHIKPIDQENSRIEGSSSFLSQSLSYFRPASGPQNKGQPLGKNISQVSRNQTSHGVRADADMILPLDIRKTIRSKEKKKLAERIKRNFPQDFFQQLINANRIL